ncbi:lysine--tRNA ligase [Candidatus Woesearchaeota archaeon]|nr:lysine--tRNA ligase [Candidatus Woesearchaeota archaeon]
METNEKQKQDKNDHKDQRAAILHWADQVAERVIQIKGDKEKYTVASGITPSGTVHIGNFREIITTELIARALRSRRKKVRFIYSWDDYDVFRKVPVNMPKQEMLQTYLRQSIVDVPDPFGKEESYARHHEVEVEEAIKKVGIHTEFLYQSKKYRACEYAEQIIHALKNKEKIKAILDKYREEPLEETWLPITVFSLKDKTDKIRNIRWDGKHTVSYELEDGTTEHADIFKSGNVKLLWRVDWPMRWSWEKVDFEPGGKDHSTVGGSFDTGKEIVKLFNWEAPVYHMYNFISIKGGAGKISSSTGEVITLNDCLEIYEPQIVRWLFAGTRPGAEFAISFDADVIKIYEDFDKCERIYYGEQKDVSEKELANQKRIYELSCVEEGKVPKAMPYQPGFRHITNVLLQNELDIEKSIGYFEKQLKSKEDRERLHLRAVCAKNWILEYAPEEFKYTINKAVPQDVKDKLTKEQRAALHELAKRLEDKEWEDKELHEECYIILKNNNLDTKNFFTACYNVLISKDKGPKLAAFLIEIKEKAIVLLKSV